MSLFPYLQLSIFLFSLFLFFLFFTFCFLPQPQGATTSKEAVGLSFNEWPAL
jgi:hypothetical protein